MLNDLAPVCAIDGPSGSGKGAVCQRVALAKGWGYLDSGALYRAFALHAVESEIRIDQVEKLQVLSENFEFSCKPNADGEAFVYHGDRDVSHEIRADEIGKFASQYAAIPEVRQGLLGVQHELRRWPGLIADGRDMGTTVFPDALLKIYLDASAEIRAQRRYNQLKQKGFSVNLRDLLLDMAERDKRDSKRSVSPLSTASDAVVVDTSHQSIEQVVEHVLAELGARLDG